MAGGTIKTRHGMIPVARPNLGEEEVKAAGDVIRSGWVTQGPKVKEFEEAFALYTGSRFACAVSSCTSALHLALLTAGIEPGDKVITVSHSFISTANCIRYCGAEPIFIDIDPDTYNISSLDLENYLQSHDVNKEKIKALLIVHQMGMPCDLKTILPLAEKYSLAVIEDAACAVGSEISLDEGKSWEKIGRPHGGIACFSFHPRKVLTTGEGGMLTTNSAQYNERLHFLRHQGMSVSDRQRHTSREIILEEYPEMGFNYRMTDIQAAIGIEQLKKLPQMIEKRRSLVKLYNRELGAIDWLKVPVEPAGCRSNWQSFPVNVLDHSPLNRDALMQYLLDQDIATRPGIMNAHQQKIYKEVNLQLKNSEEARAKVILFPLYFQMTESDIMKISEVLKNV